jgi:pentatricopeptide repeat protein
MSRKNVVSWSAMIARYANNGHANEAKTLFHQMEWVRIKPNSTTMVSILLACAHLGFMHQGEWTHDYIIRSGFESNIFVENDLVAMYSKCGRVEFA